MVVRMIFQVNYSTISVLTWWLDPSPFAPLTFMRGHEGRKPATQTTRRTQGLVAEEKKSWICETMRATIIWYSVKPWNMIMKWSSKPALLGMVEIPTGLGSESKSLCFCNLCHPREMPDCHDPRKARNMYSSMWHFRLVWNEIMLIHNIDPNVMSFATSHLPACPPEKLLTQMS